MQRSHPPPPMAVFLALSVVGTALLLLLSAPASLVLASDATALLEQAIGSYSRGDKMLAVREALAAVAKDADYAHAYNFLGVVYHDIGDSVQAPA